MIEYGLLIVGGLFLFLYGITLISNTLTTISSKSLKKLIIYATSNDYLAILIGVLITCVIHSSSAISVILIAFVSAKLINLRSSMFILMGANIGTTITTFIVSLDITKYYLIFIIIGCYLLIIAKREQLINLGNLCFGLGIFFMGLNFMSNSVSYIISNHPSMFFYLISENIYINIITSTILTSILQSSTAMLKITQDLLNLNLLSLKTALIFVVGANVGTTITGIIASFKTNKEAKILAVFNVIFNIITASFVLLSFNKYSFLISLIKDKFNLSFNDTITLFHFCFNFTGLVIISLLIPKQLNYERKKKVD